MHRLARLMAAASIAVLATGCAWSLGGTLGVTGWTMDAGPDGGPGGVFVSGLHEHSPLRAHGVRAGDVIVSIEGEAVSSARALGDRVQAAGFERPVRVGVRSGEAVREIEVVPAEARRTLTIGLVIPFLFRWDYRDDTVTLGLVHGVDIGIGPDGNGLMLLTCVGYWSTPDSWEVRLAILHFGNSYHIVAPEPAETGAARTST